MPKHVIVIGGGASGLMAAITAATNGAVVTLLEHMDKPGRKILATGNGRCNLTNVYQGYDCYMGGSPEFTQAVFKQFSKDKTIAFFTQLGIFTKNRNGYLYPFSDQASAVLEALLLEAEYRKVKIKCSEHITGIEKKEDQFLVHTDTWTYTGDSVILSTGSKAAPNTGSDGSGYHLAASLGHAVIEPGPGLVPLICGDSCCKGLAGVRSDARITLFIEGEPIAMEEGELQLTAYGISGIPVFQLSRHAVLALREGKKVTAGIHFLRAFSFDGIVAFLKGRTGTSNYKTTEQLLLGLFPKKLIPVLLQQAGISLKIKASQLTESDWNSLARAICHFPLTITGHQSYDQAQVCFGGVDTREIEPTTMESKLLPGLYFAGELVDIDGKCGGYNLQWAWSSGHIAGIHAASD